MLIESKDLFKTLTFSWFRSKLSFRRQAFGDLCDKAVDKTFNNQAFMRFAEQKKR